MEGKETHNDDDELKSGSEENANEESDDFGLPEAPFDDQKEENSEEPETNSYSSSDAISDAIQSEKEESANTSYEEKSRSNTGLIVTLIIIGIAAIMAAAYFLLIKKDKEPVVKEEPVQAVVDSTLLETPVVEPVIEEPVVEPETPDVGDFQTLSEKTGRYYVVIASFVDSDLAVDYAKILSNNGVSSSILSPDGKGFYRLALDGNYGSFSDANMQVEAVKGNYGPDVWVLRY